MYRLGTTVLILVVVLGLMVLPQGSEAQTVVLVPNAGFETPGVASDPIPGWHIGIGGGAEATISPDETVHHTGTRSVRITNRSPQKAFVYALLSSDTVAVHPVTTYVAHYWVRGHGVHGCYFGVSFQGNQEQRQYLPSGDYEWRQISCLFTTPENCRTVSLRFASDDVTASLWADDVSVEIAPHQLVNLVERTYNKPFEGVFPRSRGAVSPHLLVYDAGGQPLAVRRALAALQGIVNRRQPRLYLLSSTTPPGDDSDWLGYMQQKGYTDKDERIGDWQQLLSRFRGEISGVIIIDPDLPGSVNAAFMLAGLKRALPVSPEMAATLKLPVVMDLRGRWKHNVEAYRYIYEHYWDQMNHHILAWEYPLADYQGARDYMVEFNIFSFWVSSYSDQEKGADPDAENAFLQELLANTPANIPVMGWPMYGDTKGITEYEGVRMLSEYGKFVPGTEFCSNLSVHTAIHPKDALFQQKALSNQSHFTLDSSKIYLSLNIMDSGDGLWYWQRYQRKIWADPNRGALPIGWCLNTTLYDTLPLVMQWYYEHATPQDTFFAAVSGLGYMNTQVYASRFRTQDRERIWDQYIALTDRYRRRADMKGIELYDGGWSEQTPPVSGALQRFVHGMKGLGYIFADLGRHDNIHPDNADTLLDGVAVFHTLTRYQVWSSSAEVTQQKMEPSNAWLLQEIEAHAPPEHPGFMSSMAISWYYSPTWLQDLQKRLPSQYVLVSPGDLSALFRQFSQAQK